MTLPNSINPWEMLQPHDAERFGKAIFDENERRRWCTAIFIGGLPFMWKEASHVRQMIYQHLDLQQGNRVLLVGESNASCGFVDDLRQLVGAAGEIDSIDVIERARTMCSTGQRGKNGKLGTWRYDFMDGKPDGHYDAIALMQGVQHTEDWAETAIQMCRVLKPGGAIATGEICFGEPFEEKVKADVHIQYVMDKLFAGMGLRHQELSYWSIDDLRKAFSGLLLGQGWFYERGFEVFWGRKPLNPASAG